MTRKTTPHYAAFISYAHADELVAARLHKALETYPVPKHLRAEGKTTKPVFRDVAELTAAHSLSEKIQEAVKGSRVLIVLCSPAAKASHWVNEEIRLFRELHGEAAILSAIIEGTPETAFPAALVEGGREPLAAALRTDKAGFKLGVTQLAAGMLGTGLDDLIQRGAKRRNRLMGAGMAASIALSGVMGFATFQAVEARNEAEAARGDAEGLVEYMIKDLKFKLEPVGRLDLLQGIGDKAVEYYDKQDFKDLNDSSLNRQAAARQVLAQVHLDSGRMEEAQREIEAAATLTREVLERNPNDTDAIFAHAQSEYWVGDYYFNQADKLFAVEKPWNEYNRLAQLLYQKDSTNFDWVMEAGWGRNNLGSLARELSTEDMASIALQHYNESIAFFEQAVRIKPDSKYAQIELANAMAGKASILLASSTVHKARRFKLEYLDYLKNLSDFYPNDQALRLKLHVSKTDYYNGYFLKLNEEERLKVLKSLDQIFELTRYDPENLGYKISFLQAAFNLFENFDATDLTLMKKRAEILLNEIPESSEINIGYYASMIRVFEIKLDLSKENKVATNDKLKKISQDYLNKRDYSLQDWKIIYNVFRQNQKMGNQDTTGQYARLFLKEITARSEIDYPTIVFRKLEAQLALKNCDAVSSLARDLKAREYFEDLDVNFSPCDAF